MRFRLRTLLIVTAWAALISLGFASPTHLWSGVVATATLVTILSGLLMAFYCTGPSRAMAVGYLLFCVGYLFHLTFLATWMSRAMDDGATTSLWSLFFQLYEIVHPPDGSPIQLRNANRFNFTAIGHNAIACLLGMAGAMAAEMLYRRQHREDGPVNAR
jgi:hypothetical protein